MSSFVLFVIDWDDTLFATTHQRKGAATKNEWNSLSKIVSLLLHKMRLMGQVVIVTNGESGWVERCVRIHMPQLQPLLSHVRVLSARSMFSTYEEELLVRQDKLEVSSMIRWKAEAIRHILDGCSSLPSCIVGMGDSDVELHALNQLVKEKSIAKSCFVKFTYQPTWTSVWKQLRYVCSILHALVRHSSSLRVTLDPNVFLSY